MADNCHIEYAACKMIVTPLDDTCSIVAGALSYVTTGFVSLSAETEVETGTDYSAKSASGALCGVNQGPDIEKWQNISGELCLINWGMVSLLTGSPAVVNGTGDVIGYEQLLQNASECSAASTGPRVALTIIRQASTDDGGCVAGATTGATNCVAYHFPMVTNWKFAEPAFEDARTISTFTARGFTNPNIGRGPFNLWPADATPATISPDSILSRSFVDCSTLPAASCDPIPHPAVL
jgi:hypothetical protein